MNAVPKAPLTHTHRIKNKRHWGQEAADEERQRLHKVMVNASPGDVIVVDASEVEVFDVSYAAGLFIPTITSLTSETNNLCLLIEGLNTITRKNLDPAIRDAGLMSAEMAGKEVKLIGKFSASDEQTLQFMKEYGRPCSARDFAEQLDIRVTAANERLTKLARMGILLKSATAGGRTQQLFNFPTL